MKKQIPTWKSLLIYYRKLLRETNEEFLKALESSKGLQGLGFLPPGVSLKANHNGCRFSLHWKGEEQPFCTVTGVWLGKKSYTYYEPRLTKSKLTKGMLECLPIDLPYGIKFKNHSDAWFFNVDGSKELKGVYTDFGTRSPRRPKGSFSKHLVIDNATGKFIYDPVVTTRVYELRQNFHAAELKAGLVLGSIPGEAEWLESMRPPEGVAHSGWLFDKDREKYLGLAASTEPLWDYEGIKRLALKVLAAAKEFLSHAPHMRIAFLPAGMTDRMPTSLRFDRFHRDYTWGHQSRDDLVIGWQPHEQGGNCITWTPPGLALYSVGPATSEHEPAKVQHIKVTLPPFGCKGLDPDQFNSLPSSRVDRDSLLTGSQAMGALRSKWVPEQAYHGLSATLNRTEVRGHHRSSHVTTWDSTSSETRWNYKWSKESEMVVVEDNYDLHGGNWRNQGLPPYISSPEDVFSVYEEKAIMESLPVC